MQCFDSSGTKLEFQEMETFGFLPVPEIMMEDAMRGVEVKSGRGGMAPSIRRVPYKVAQLSQLLPSDTANGGSAWLTKGLFDRLLSVSHIFVPDVVQKDA